jgi:hypothetical protein
VSTTNNIFVGIDFSLVSPGICIVSNKVYKWISVYSLESEDHHKLLSKEGPFKILDESESVTIKLLNKTVKQGITYSHTERNKLNASIEEVDFIIKEIKKHLEGLDGNIYVGIEGVSFGAAGNTLIDICMSTGLLRAGIVTDLLDGDSSRFYVFSPGTIKKFAGKGTFKKPDMYDALINKPGLEQLEFVNLLTIYKDAWITPGGMVKPPLSDLVDATWIALLVKEVQENGFKEEEKPLKKKKEKKKKETL